MNERDEYRVLLFKKKLRVILGAPWVRFYWSKDGMHLCIDAWHHGPENMEPAAAILQRAGIDIVVHRDKYGLHRMFGDENGPAKIDEISIPIDQDAMPERKRATDQRNRSLQWA